MLQFILCIYSYAFVAFSHIYFQRQKFSFQTHMTRNTGARRWSRSERVLWVHIRRICGFLLVSNSNFGPILHRF